MSVEVTVQWDSITGTQTGSFSLCCPPPPSPLQYIYEQLALLFPTLPPPFTPQGPQFRMVYVDDEHEEIGMESDFDLLEALQISMSKQPAILQIFIRQPNPLTRSSLLGEDAWDSISDSIECAPSVSSSGVISQSPVVLREERKPTLPIEPCLAPTGSLPHVAQTIAPNDANSTQAAAPSASNNTIWNSLFGARVNSDEHKQSSPPANVNDSSLLILSASQVGESAYPDLDDSPQVDLEADELDDDEAVEEAVISILANGSQEFRSRNESVDEDAATLNAVKDVFAQMIARSQEALHLPSQSTQPSQGVMPTVNPLFLHLISGISPAAFESAIQSFVNTVVQHAHEKNVERESARVREEEEVKQAMSGQPLSPPVVAVPVPAPAPRAAPVEDKAGVMSPPLPQQQYQQQQQVEPPPYVEPQAPPHPPSHSIAYDDGLSYVPAASSGVEGSVNHSYIDPLYVSVPPVAVPVAHPVNDSIYAPYPSLPAASPPLSQQSSYNNSPSAMSAEAISRLESHRQSLESLAAMGFNDVQLNTYLLNKHVNDFNAVVEWLTDMSEMSEDVRREIIQQIVMST